MYKGNPKGSGRGGRQAGRGTLVSETHKGASLTAIGIRSTPLFPPKVYKWLRYATTSTTVTATSGIPTAYQFRANSAFDPDFTSTGHQPMGFDQMMVSFNHFTVAQARIRVTARNVGSSTCNVALRQDADSTILTDKDRIMEFGGIVAETLEAKTLYGANKEMSLAVDMGKIQGISRSALTADTSLRGSSASDPTEITYFQLVVWDAAGTTSSVIFDVVLDQLCIFTEPRTMSISEDLRTAVAYLKGTEGKHSLHTSRFGEATAAFKALMKTPGSGTPKLQEVRVPTLGSFSHGYEEKTSNTTQHKIPQIHLEAQSPSPSNDSWDGEGMFQQMCAMRFDAPATFERLVARVTGDGP